MATQSLMPKIAGRVAGHDKGLEGNEIEIGRTPFTRQTVQSGVCPIRIQTPIVEANSRITAKIASASGGSDTATIKILYHMY